MSSEVRSVIIQLTWLEKIHVVKTTHLENVKTKRIMFKQWDPEVHNNVR